LLLAKIAIDIICIAHYTLFFVEPFKNADRFCVFLHFMNLRIGLYRLRSQFFDLLNYLILTCVNLI
jgi:hypothetical protein